jgi:SAM-dependent methyltransferase
MHKYSYFHHNWIALKINNDQIKKILPELRGVVYDFGCGRRPYEKDILRYADKYVGIDWSNTPHGVNAELIANLNDPLPIHDQSADNIVSFQVLEHLSEPQTMLNEAFRILCADGQLFLSTPFQWHLHEAPWDYFRFTNYGLMHMLTKAGFIDIKISAVSGFWVTWVMKFNYQLIRLIRGPKLLRILLRTFAGAIWFTNQHIALWLDKYNRCEGETMGYFVVAKNLNKNHFYKLNI